MVNHGFNALADRFDRIGFGAERIVDAKHYEDKIWPKVLPIKPTFTALRRRHKAVQHMFDTIARYAQIKRGARWGAGAKTFVPDAAAAEFTGKPRIGVEMPEIGDRIADKHDFDRSEAGGIFQLAVYFVSALLPVVNSRGRNLRSMHSDGLR